MLPDDYLIPVMRCSPAHAARVWTVGLDPREAAFVLGRGFITVDGVRYRVTLEGCDGRPQRDGRVQVRCDSPSEALLYLPEPAEVAA
jgi:hypothetical protein